MCFWEGVPSRPAALTRSGCPTRAGAAGRRAGRRPGRRRCGRTSRCGRTGTCPPPACISAPGGTGQGWDAPMAHPHFGGSSRGQGRGRYLFLFPGKRPVCFGYERLQRGDVVVAQINLRQGSTSGAGGAPGRRQHCPQAPYLVALVPGHGQRHLGLLAGHDVFPAGGEPFSLRRGTNCARAPQCWGWHLPAPCSPPSVPTCFFHSPVQPNLFPGAGFPVPPLSVLINGKRTAG